MTTYAAALDAYWAFLETFNSKDPDAWADVMSYPHVRVSPRGDSHIFETAADYSSTHASWQRFEATGWVRTQGIEPETVHQADDTVHLAGGWTRFDADDGIILENRVTYVITKVGESWGIQARFGVDSWGGEQGASPTETAAVDLIERYIKAWGAQDLAACAALCNIPLIQANPGDVQRWPDAAACAEALSARPWAPLSSHDVRATQVGGTAVNVAVEATLDGGDRREQAAFLVTRRDDHWGIQGRSVIEL
ncbi:MAG: hypothetical protein QF664_09855 [Dehalococcoidia bacterium]|nr:hypothetical protein [Dehalococcoidia bacterium]